MNSICDARQRKLLRKLSPVLRKVCYLDNPTLPFGHRFYEVHVLVWLVAKRAVCISLACTRPKTMKLQS